MTDAPATNELMALANRISATPSYTGKDLRTWHTPILERCDGDGDGNAVSVILVDAKQREVLVNALRAAATPSAQGAEVSVEELAKLACVSVLQEQERRTYIVAPPYWAYEAIARTLLGKYRMEKR